MIHLQLERPFDLLTEVWYGWNWKRKSEDQIWANDRLYNVGFMLRVLGS